MSEFDEPKFRELIVYIAMKCDDEPHFEAGKLNRHLFYSDFVAYRVLGSAITGAEYEALPYGPAPKQLPLVRSNMIREGAIALQARGNQHRVVALRDADLAVFSASEIAIVDRIIDKRAELDAECVSELSHAFLGWKAAMAQSLAHRGRQVTIPYSTAFVSNRRLDEFERGRLLALGQRHGWFPAD